jgi:peptidyl-prolyl cis-trans isomerase A (cyclophilin A)
MAYSRVMRIGWLVLGCAALIGCGSPEPAKKAEAPKTTEKPPEVYTVNFDTSKGTIKIEVRREWAPHGADHFYDLVKTGFYDNSRFFRVVRNFVVQFGIAADPKVNELWATGALPDDPVVEHNRRGTITYAKRGPNTRTTQVFINLKDNSESLDSTGFAPFGKVTEGMDVVENLYNSYGDMPPRGQGPDPSLIQTQGNGYLESRFPRLDYIKKATIQ